MGKIGRRQRLETAHHEAARCAAIAHGLSVESVSVLPADGPAGTAGGAHLDRAIYFADDDPSAHVEALRVDITACRTCCANEAATGEAQSSGMGRRSQIGRSMVNVGRLLGERRERSEHRRIWPRRPDRTLRGGASLRRPPAPMNATSVRARLLKSVGPRS